MTRLSAAGIAAALLLATSASAAPQAASCPARLKTAENERALTEVKLQEEIERADAQTYLTRLELSVTKKRLADALAKCGAACAPAGK